MPVGFGDTPARPAGRDACRYTDQRNSLSSHAELQGNQSLSVAGFTHSKQRGAAIFRSCARVSRCFDGIGLFPKPWRGDLPPVRRGAIRYNAGLFLKCSERRKDGKVHRSWSVVESHRYAGGKIAQRHVLYLGEINDSQRLAWERSLAVFDEPSGETHQLALFPAGRPSLRPRQPDGPGHPVGSWDG